MFKMFLATLLVFMFSSFLNAEESYIFKAKGEFAKELKSLMDKYAKEGKVEIQEVDESYKRTKTTGIVDTFLNNDDDIRGDIKYGKQIYDKTCFKCHGINAEVSYYNNARILSTLDKKTLVNQIESYSTDASHGGTTGVIMSQAVVGMNEIDIVSVSAYIYSINHSKDLSTPVESTQNIINDEKPSSYLQ